LFIFIFRDMLCVILEYIICIRGGKKRTMGIPDFQKLDKWDTNKTHVFFGVKYFESFMRMISLFGIFRQIYHVWAGIFCKYPSQT
jgi:hypothetical protein